jgi:hypothetical protein
MRNPHKLMLPFLIWWWLLQLTLEIFNVVLDHNLFHNGHERTLVKDIREKEKYMLWGQKGKAQNWREGQSDLMQLQKMKIAQPTKNLMIAVQELLVMMVTMEMTLVMVPAHLPHKEEVMSDLSLPSRPTSSHTAPGWRPRCPDIAKNSSKWG